MLKLRFQRILFGNVRQRDRQDLGVLLEHLKLAALQNSHIAAMSEIRSCSFAVSN